MSTMIDIDSLHLEAKEASAVSQFILERVMGTPGLNMVHRLQAGVKMKEQIVFAGQLGMIGLKATGCVPVSTNARATLTEKFWDPVKIEDRFINCAAEYNALFKAYFSHIKTYQEKYDMTGSPFAELIATLIIEGMNQAIWRLAWHGDTTAIVAGPTTPGLAGAHLLPLYTPLDGLWKQIIEGVASGRIAKVGVAPSATQTFENLYSAADTRLRNARGAILLVSRALFDSYKSELKASSMAFTVDYTMYGLPSITWDGIPVINMESAWDVHFQNFKLSSASNAATLLPNRAVLTTPDNIPIATLNESSLSSLTSFYDAKDRVNITDFGFTLDAKLLEDYMVSVAYGERENSSI